MLATYQHAIFTVSTKDARLLSKLLKDHDISYRGNILWCTLDNEIINKLINFPCDMITNVNSYSMTYKNLFDSYAYVYLVNCRSHLMDNFHYVMRILANYLTNNESIVPDPYCKLIMHLYTTNPEKWYRTHYYFLLHTNEEEHMTMMRLMLEDHMSIELLK